MRGRQAEAGCVERLQALEQSLAHRLDLRRRRLRPGSGRKRKAVSAMIVRHLSRPRFLLAA
jgi:hypothetical protein